MGLFDKVLGKDGGETKLDKKEAFGAVAVAPWLRQRCQSEVQRVAIDLMTLRHSGRRSRDPSNILSKEPGSSRSAVLDRSCWQPRLA
jgi:hypothetical protein